ncbi:hypothetical protein ALI22I_43015 [Saccharothrix sp. ALI-22-I]|uniref:hypothetical protein n=1 Tax=Saccharothrix sp. ALI-22-I TaxID=1933778 RepID=UPI00097C6064|nr:hypothetical protein [Saccharothrix sp. ALI-22-I]ONI80173.1 hypothetical protein ALI22I_43015 [Saccharothrix sp. ALI-22-I]
MPKNRLKIGEIAQQRWVGPGEQVVWVVDPEGHVGSTVGPSRTVPHRTGAAALEVPEPEWPLPTRAVGEGRFHNDEWVHDPAVWAWAHAQRPDQAAVRWADLFTAGRDECRLVLTNRRLALVVDGEVTRPAAPASGGLLGRVRALGQSQPDVAPLVTWWDAPVGTARLEAVPLGRQVGPEWFVRIGFPDGSTFEFRDAQAEQSIRTAHANL